MSKAVGAADLHQDMVSGALGTQPAGKRHNVPMVTRPEVETVTTQPQLMVDLTVLAIAMSP